MNKAMLKLLLPLLVALSLGCRSVPREEAAGQTDSAAVSPEMPPGTSERDAESAPPVTPPPQAAAGMENEAAAEAGPSSVTLPRSEGEPPAGVDGTGTAAGLELPLPETEPGDPLTRLNSLPPDLDKEYAWPPLESYWRLDQPPKKEAEKASADGQVPAAVTAAAADRATAPAPSPAAESPDRKAAPPTAQPAAAAPKGPQAAPAASPAAPAAPAGRQILARPDDRVEVQLDGTGWLFLGFGPQVADEDVSFLSRESNDGRTSFTFRAHELGSYDLSFQLQDVREGSTREETVTLQVLPEEEFDRRLASTREDAAAGVEPAPDYERAEKLYARGELDLALVEFIRNYREGDGYANDRIAAIYLAGREYEAALKYYRRNLDIGAAAYRDRAVLGAVRAGLGLGDPDLVLEFLEDLLGLRSLPIAGELLESARLQLRAGRHAVARLLLREYRTRYPRGERMDEVLFLLGQLYEQDSPLRDLEISRAYYQRVYDEYPESLLADEAYERLRYLDRHFFHVQ